MTSIWASDAEGWRLLAPVGFPDEAALHDLVEQSPELLPLAGSPQLIVLGREVPIGGGYADLLAVEPSGRIVIVEVKLASNAEARRAVVAQILAYAAFLRGSPVEVLEGEILRSHLRRSGYETISQIARDQDQEGSFDEAAFNEELASSLAAGRFRLVLVLDDAPAELVRLVSYLESVAPELVIDLVTVGAFDVNGSRVLVPQRVDAERSTRAPAVERKAPQKEGHLIPPEDFETKIAEATPEAQADLRRTYAWAKQLERDGLIRLLAYQGSGGRLTLLPYVLNDDAGLITVWNDGGFSISFWRSVFERRAPNSIPQVEALLAPSKIGQGNTTRELSDELLAALRAAYAEAAA